VHGNITVNLLLFLITLNDTNTYTHTHTHKHTHRVGHLWMNDQPVEETSTWYHTTLTRDRYLCPGRIRTHNPSKQTAM